MSPARAQRLATERRAFAAARARIAEWEGGHPRIARYQAAAAVVAPSRFRSLSSFETMIRRAVEGRLTYVGDFHTNPESQRTLLRMVRALSPRVESLALGTEFVAGCFQEELDRYLAGRIGERTFLERTRYRELWPYDVWTGMKPVLQFCRESGVPVLALDAFAEDADLEDAFDLDARDAYAAGRIADWLVARPRGQLVVHFGELHVAESHLPRAVDQELARRGLDCRRLVVNQNAERIYWRLLAEGRERVRVVEVDRRRFCVINTRPHRQQETYLDWLEGHR